MDLHNCQMALATANQKHVTCYDALQQCSGTYEGLYAAYFNIHKEMESLTTTNNSLCEQLKQTNEAMKTS